MKKTTLQELNKVLKKRWKVKFDDYEAIKQNLEKLLHDDLPNKIMKNNKKSV